MSSSRLSVKGDISLNALIQIIMVIIIIGTNIGVCHAILQKKLEIAESINSLNNLYDTAVLLSYSPHLVGKLKYETKDVNIDYLWIRSNAQAITDDKIGYLQLVWGVKIDRIDMLASGIYTYLCTYTYSQVGFYLGSLIIDPSLCTQAIGDFAYYFREYLLNPIVGFFSTLGSAIYCGIISWFGGQCEQCNFPADNYEVGDLLEQGTTNLIAVKESIFVPVAIVTPLIYPNILDLNNGFGVLLNKTNPLCKDGFIQTQGERAKDNCKDSCNYEVLHVLQNIHKLELVKEDNIRGVHRYYRLKLSIS